jgi:proline dehydrogenase
MLYLTERFDYFWYGMFACSEQDFNAYLEKYREAIRQARQASEARLALDEGRGEGGRG